MGPRGRRGHPAPGRALEQAELEEERLVDVLHRLRLLAHADGEGRQAHGAAAEAPAHRDQDGPVDLVEAGLVDLEQGQALAGGGLGDDALGPDLGVVADPAQQPVGDAGRAPGPAGDLVAAGGVEGDAHDPGRPHDDGLQLGDVVVVEAGDEAEPVAEGAGDEAGAGGGADQGEPGQVEAQRPGRGALAEDDVELEVLHRRVEHFLDHPGQAVDLVDEQDVALVEVGQHRRQVAGPLQRRPRRDPHGHPHLGGDDAGQAGLAQARRAGEQQVVGGLTPPAGGLQEDLQVLAELGLADELLQPAGPQRDLVGRLPRRGQRREQLVAGHRASAR